MRRLLKVTAAGMVVGTLGVIMSITPFGKELEENTGLHLLFKMRGVRRAPPDVGRALLIYVGRRSAYLWISVARIESSSSVFTLKLPPLIIWHPSKLAWLVA